MKLVKVKDLKEFYPHYKEWVVQHAPKLAHLYIENSAPEADRAYIQVFVGFHFRNQDTILALIQDPIKNQVFVINARALEDVEILSTNGPQNVVVKGIAPLTILECEDILDEQIKDLKNWLDEESSVVEVMSSNIQIGLLSRVADELSEKFDSYQGTSFTPDDVEELIDEIKDIASSLTEEILRTMDLIDFESKFASLLGKEEN